MGTHEENTSGPVLGKRKGTPQFSLSSAHCPQPPKSEAVQRRGTYDNHMNYTTNWSSYQASQRNASLCTAFSSLSVKDPQPTEAPQLQDTPKSRLPTPNPSKNTSFITPSPSPSKSRRNSPQKQGPHFLTRYSNTKAWDTEERVDGSEQLMQMFYEKMETLNKESASVAETIAMHKFRSKLFCLHMHL